MWLESWSSHYFNRVNESDKFIRRIKFNVGVTGYRYSYEKKTITHPNGSVDTEVKKEHSSLIFSVEKIETSESIKTRFNIQFGNNLGLYFGVNGGVKIQIYTEIIKKWKATLDVMLDKIIYIILYASCVMIFIKVLLHFYLDRLTIHPNQAFINGFLPMRYFVSRFKGDVSGDLILLKKICNLLYYLYSIAFVLSFLVGISRRLINWCL